MIANPIPFSDLDSIPEYLRNLSTLVIALITPDGKVSDANRGFLFLAGTENFPPESLNAHGLFLNPGFTRLVEASAQYGKVYEGILNIGNIDVGTQHSIHGTVYRLENRLLVVGEPNIIELERLNAMVIDLNDEMAEMQRSLVRYNNELKHNEARIRELMLTDPLTGLANRRHLSDVLEQNIERSRRHNRPLSVIMMDIDHFKLVNDNYGHDVGDDVIRMTANCLRDGIRTNDLASRFGGEEFVALLEGCPLEDALHLAERIRECISLQVVPPIPHSITTSFGVAELGQMETALSLLKRADQALYFSKQHGRNRVSTAPPLEGG